MSSVVDFRRVRQDLGLTQEEMARMVGVTFVTVSRYENGHAEPHSLVFEVYDAIATVILRGRKKMLLDAWERESRQRFLMALFDLAYG